MADRLSVICPAETGGPGDRVIGLDRRGQLLRPASPWGSADSLCPRYLRRIYPEARLGAASARCRGFRSPIPDLLVPQRATRRRSRPWLGRAGHGDEVQIRRTSSMAKSPQEKEASPEVRALPMDLQLGDRLAGERSEWRVIGEAAGRDRDSELGHGMRADPPGGSECVCGRCSKRV